MRFRIGVEILEPTCYCTGKWSKYTKLSFWVSILLGHLISRKVAGRYLLQDSWANGQRIWKRLGSGGGDPLWLYSGTSGQLGIAARMEGFYRAPVVGSCFWHFTSLRYWHVAGTKARVVGARGFVWRSIVGVFFKNNLIQQHSGDFQGSIFILRSHSYEDSSKDWPGEVILSNPAPIGSSHWFTRSTKAAQKSFSCTLGNFATAEQHGGLLPFQVLMSFVFFFFSIWRLELRCWVLIWTFFLNVSLVC